LRGLEEQDGDAAGWDVVGAEVGEEALESSREEIRMAQRVPATLGFRMTPS